MCSAMSSEPSGAIRTEMSAAGSEYAPAAPGSASAASAAASSSAFRMRLAGRRPGGRRRGGRRRDCASALAEVDAWRFAGDVLGLEVLARPEVEPAGDDARRHGLERVLVAEDGVVVDLARDRDALLDVGELRLELLEVLGRAQLRVRLGDREQPAEGGGQHVLGLGLLRDALRLLRGDARVRDGLERLALVRGIA